MILAVLPVSPPASPNPPPPLSKLLIVVWSLEQDQSIVGGDRSARRTTGGKKGAVPVSEREADPDGVEVDEGDVFVPWERQGANSRADKAPKQQRKRRDPTGARDGDLAPSTNSAAAPSAADATAAPSSAPATFNRYYHLFRRQELAKLVMQAANALSLDWEACGEWLLSADLLKRPEDAEVVVEKSEGWEACVLVGDERWERENWVVEVEVGWRPVRRVSG
jgi:tRNA (uracil-5-)-methyltransferase TRM9